MKMIIHMKWNSWKLSEETTIRTSLSKYIYSPVKHVNIIFLS